MVSTLRARRTTVLNSFALVAAAALPLAATAPSQASSHREAPFITTHPKVDGTDFYMFNSYEPGRAGYVTLIANYQPFEDPQGGPNYYTMDPKALYEIHIDNNGDGVEDLTFQFRFKVADSGLAVMAGGKSIPVPLSNIGPLAATSTAAQNVIETYSVTLVRGDRRAGQPAPITDAATGSATFSKPFDNIGVKSIPNYAAYAGNFIYTVTIPGCDKPGRVFVGQRKDPFVVNLGETFDLVNFSNPLGPVNGEKDSLADKNVTSLILE